MTIMTGAPEPYGIVARLFTGGPILAVQRVNVIGISDATQNDLTTLATSSFMGYKVCNSPLTVVNLPAGGRIEVSILRAGVIFANGGTLKIIYPSDISDGRVNLGFLVPYGLAGGYCHSLMIYDRQGAYLGSR